MKRIILRDWEASAFYAGRLTQLRRLVKPQPPEYESPEFGMYHPLRCNRKTGEQYPAPEVFGCWCDGWDVPCPLGGPGSRLWVAEAWARVHPGFLQHLDPDPDSFEWTTLYKADSMGGYEGKLMEYTQWMSPAVMPKHYSRSIIELTAVRVERVQEVTEGEAQACGSDRVLMPDRGVIATPVDSEDELNCRFKNGFQFQWECDHGQASWDANPWVWVLDVRRVEP